MKTLLTILSLTFLPLTAIAGQLGAGVPGYGAASNGLGSIPYNYQLRPVYSQPSYSSQYQAAMQQAEDERKLQEFQRLEQEYMQNQLQRERSQSSYR